MKILAKAGTDPLALILAGLLLAATLTGGVAAFAIGFAGAAAAGPAAALTGDAAEPEMSD
ncbi:MAG TPA: hypothetical protein VMM55_01625 [Thermohalobaculum sp.]|nr:hypothetical protein [Thermohalobaculum sp.]